jgi:hypothetical protein
VLSCASTCCCVKCFHGCMAGDGSKWLRRMYGEPSHQEPRQLEWHAIVCAPLLSFSVISKIIWHHYSSCQTCATGAFCLKCKIPRSGMIYSLQWWAWSIFLSFSCHSLNLVTLLDYQMEWKQQMDLFPLNFWSHGYFIHFDTRRLIVSASDTLCYARLTNIQN